MAAVFALLGEADGFVEEVRDRPLSSVDPVPSLAGKPPARPSQRREGTRIELDLAATATDGVDNSSPCSAPISYTNTATIGPGTSQSSSPGQKVHQLRRRPRARVSKLVGKTLPKPRQRCGAPAARSAK
jgi:hypothetical protein